MRVARTRGELARALTDLRSGGSLALVPTMGFLHDGHLALVDRAGEVGDATVVSIFVNPLQFGPGEDLERYPRDEPRDLALLEARGVALAFVPDVAEMYPGGEPRVTVDPGPLAERLCGAFRPGHFRGVLTVVAKLFGLVRPDRAVFGAKDFQQAVLVRRMASDLDLGVEVLTVPIVREPDGLAMSSRNANLSAAERAAAPALVRGLRTAAEAFDRGESRADALLSRLRARVEEQGGVALQYAEIVDPDTLDALDPVEPGAVIAVAGHAGSTRLIDNLGLR
jgi:pantoate--beta-alanine ligase